MNPEKLVAKARKIKEDLVSGLDPLMNKDSMLTLGGVGGFVTLKIATLALTKAHIPEPHDLATLVTTLPFAYPIFKGAARNLREYFSGGKTLRLAQTGNDINHMTSAGVSLHFAGEYAQILAYALGGSDFGQGFYYGSDLKQFLTDPYLIPFWSLNIPGFYLMGKSLVSQARSCIGGVREQIQWTRALFKQKPDHLEPK